MILAPEYHAKDPLLAAFIDDVHAIIDRATTLEYQIGEISDRMRHLMPRWKMPDPRYKRMQRGAYYGSYILYLSDDAGLVVVLDTFASGQSTPIHNHRTWGVVALMEGNECSELYLPTSDLSGPPLLLSKSESRPGDITYFPETTMHRLCTQGGVDSVSLHVYGADVGVIKRLCWDPDRHSYEEFRQGWSNDAEGLQDYFQTTMLEYGEVRRRSLGMLNGNNECLDAP